MDTSDEIYQKEQDFFDENDPIYQGLVTRYYSCLLNSTFRDKLEDKWGSQLFTIAELKQKVFSPEIIEDLKEENRLQSEYVKLIASAKIMFEGQERNLAGILPFELSPDRNIRKRAAEARFSFYALNEDALDSIYDSLVKVRTNIARKLGYKNFIPVAYARLMRSDYNPEMVSKFREQVRQYITPAAVRLYERQGKRLGLGQAMYYDEDFKFPEGNPCPKGDIGWVINKTGEMFRQLSKETGEFFKFMSDNELLDLETRSNKAWGGYCEYISLFKSPFIFSNFNGTYDDIITLTHECGHGFQAYSSRNFDIPEYYFPTYDASEIHSMSMELLTWPWMGLFFGEDENKYKYINLSEALAFIPYGVAVDEFQHYVYENPEASPSQRKIAWKEVEKKYLPFRNYDVNDYLERGGFWQKQGHIYEDPFYYIDYTLAEICAFQFWKKSNEDRERAWSDYLKLCKEGGSKSFTKLVSLSGLISPFDDGCVKSVIDDIERQLIDIENKLY
jgi:M3 family oligoendopeptidase